MIAEQNAIITQILIDSPLKFQLIDAYSVTIDRGDRHQETATVCIIVCQALQIFGSRYFYIL